MMLRLLLLCALLPGALSAGILKLADGTEIEGTFSFSAAGGLRLRTTEGGEHAARPGEFRSLSIDATDTIWPEELRVVRTNEFGLLGEYFAGREFKGTPRVRVDTDVNFRWGGGGPFENWRHDDFSARWTGHFQVEETGDYEFITWSDDGVRLFINGKQLIANWSDHALTENKTNVRLEAAELHEIRIEYFENSGDAELRVEWAGRDKQRRPLGELVLITDGAGVTEGDSRKQTPIGLQSGLVLRDGTFLKTKPRRANDTAFELEAPFDGRTISTFSVARVVFRDIPASLAATARPGRQGALLVGGDFVDSEFQSLENGILNLSSLLFGLQKLDTKYETHALFLREPRAERVHWRVRDRAGSVFLAETLSFTDSGLMLSNAILREIALPLDTLVEIESGTPVDLFPASLQFGPDSIHAAAKTERRSDDAERRRIDSLKRMASQEKSRREREMSSEAGKERAELATLEEARRKVAETESKHAVAHRELTDQRNAFNEKQKAYDNLTKQREELAKALAEINRHHSRLRSEIDKIESQQKRDSSQARNLEKNLNKRGADRNEDRQSAMRNQLEDFRRQLAELRTTHARLDKEIDVVAGQRKAKERAVSENKRDLAGRKSALDRSRRSLQSAERQLAYLDGVLKQYRARLAAAEEVVAERRRAQLR